MRQTSSVPKHHLIQRGLFPLPPLGDARGWPRDRGRGSGWGVGDWKNDRKRLIKSLQDLNQTTRLKAHAFRPCSRPLGRVGWRCVRVCLRHPGLTNLSRKRAKLRRNAFGLNDRILQAKTHSPRQPRFALQPAKREWRWAGTGGEKGKTKDPRRLPRAFCFGLIIQKCNFCHFYISYRYSSQTVR